MYRIDDCEVTVQERITSVSSCGDFMSKIVAGYTLDISASGLGELTEDELQVNGIIIN